MAGTPQKSRTASLHDGTYAEFVGLLVERRKKAGMSQHAVAEALGWNQSIVAKIETAQRRIDVVELARLAAVVGFDVVSLMRELIALMRRTGELDS